MIRTVLGREIMLFSIAVTLLTVAAITLTVNSFVTPRLESKLIKRGESITHALSDQCINLILTRDFFRLNIKLHDFKIGEESVSYIFVQSPDGEVPAHSYAKSFPVTLKKLTPKLDANGHRIARISDGKTDIIDISYPILDGRLGWLHVGMSADTIRTDVNEILGSFSIIIFLLLLALAAIMIFLEKGVIVPIRDLQSVVTNVGEGEVQSRAIISGKDEISMLGLEFNKMMDSLSEANETILQEKEQLIESEERYRTLNLTLEQKVLERTAELQKANSELESFLYSVSHEMRAPIARMEGFSEILAETSAEGEQRHIAERINAASRRMRDVIDALLTLNRLSRADYRIEEVDLSSMARLVVSELRIIWPHSPQVNIQDGIHARGDNGMLGNCMKNLLANAFKYTSKTADPEIEFSLDNTGDVPVFAVRDNGTGFDMADAKQLFEPFGRVHSAEEFKGDGLGLAVVKRIIDRHGGRIWAESSPGKGAVFYFTLMVS